jgi:hypothetical protein
MYDDQNLRQEILEMFETAAHEGRWPGRTEWLGDGFRCFKVKQPRDWMLPRVRQPRSDLGFPFLVDAPTFEVPRAKGRGKGQAENRVRARPRPLYVGPRAGYVCNSCRAIYFTAAAAKFCHPEKRKVA